MVEITMELTGSKLASKATDWGLLNRLEREALGYVLKKLTRAWEMKGAGSDER